MTYLCVDFDGVVHSYDSGWQGADVVADGPVPGAFMALYAYSKEFKVCIYSSRSKEPGGIQVMQEWMMHHLEDVEFFDGDMTAEKFVYDVLQWPTQKPAAFMTIDDRAICFNGRWPSIQFIKNFKPWNKLEGDELLPGQYIEDQGLSNEMIGIVRQILTVHNVPAAGFLDDHVKNAIVQRDKLARVLNIIATIPEGSSVTSLEEMSKFASQGLKDAGIKKMSIDEMISHMKNIKTDDILLRTLDSLDKKT